MAAKQEPLFPELNTARDGDKRRKRPLFLPSCLKEESHYHLLRGKAQDKAYEIILRWADLESSGKLEDQKETALEAEFLTQIFGDALGYTLFSEGKQRWNLKPKFFVNGGEADAAIVNPPESGQELTSQCLSKLKGLSCEKIKSL